MPKMVLGLKYLIKVPQNNHNDAWLALHCGRLLNIFGNKMRENSWNNGFVGFLETVFVFFWPKRKEFCPIGSKFFSFRGNLYSEGQNNLKELSPLKVYPFPLINQVCLKGLLY